MNGSNTSNSCSPRSSSPNNGSTPHNYSTKLLSAKLSQVGHANNHNNNSGGTSKRSRVGAAGAFRREANSHGFVDSRCESPDGDSVYQCIAINISPDLGERIMISGERNVIEDVFPEISQTLMDARSSVAWNQDAKVSDSFRESQHASCISNCNLFPLSFGGHPLHTCASFSM